VKELLSQEDKNTKVRQWETHTTPATTATYQIKESIPKIVNSLHQ